MTEDSATRNVLEGDNLADIPEQVAALSLGLVHPSGWDSYLNASYYDQTCSTYTCDRAGVDDRFLRTEVHQVFGTWSGTVPRSSPETVAQRA